MAGTERAGGPLGGLVRGLSPRDAEPRAMKTSSTSEVFFSLPREPRRRCSGPAARLCSAGVGARPIPVPGAAVLLQSCTAALGGIPEFRMRLRRVMKAPSAAQRERDPPGAAGGGGRGRGNGAALGLTPGTVSGRAHPGEGTA